MKYYMLMRICQLHFALVIQTSKYHFENILKFELIGQIGKRVTFIFLFKKS